MSTIWEVRPTVGSDTNGGGFTSGGAGTDYSQQNAKNSSGNNQSTTDGVANGTTTFTSATASFTAAIVGNLLYLAGTGVTTGWYPVASFTNATTVVLSSSPGTGTGITMHVGGAFATFTPVVAAYGTGDTAYIKATGTLTITANIGPLHYSISIVGYFSVRGDGGQATITTATSSISLIRFNNGPCAYSFFNLILSNTASVRAPALSADNSVYAVNIAFVNCVIDGCSTLTDIGNNDINADPLLLDSCEIKNCTGSGFSWAYNTAFNAQVLACYFHNNTGDGWHSTSQNGAHVFERCVFASNGGRGFNVGGSGGTNQMVLMNCAAWDNTGDGFKFLDVTGEIIWNTIAYGNGGYGIDQGNNAQPPFTDVRNCAFGSNASGAHTGLATTGDVTLTADPFVSAGTGNFRLNNTSGAGAACMETGYPSTIPG
jgi:hypothetical protein